MSIFTLPIPGQRTRDLTQAPRPLNRWVRRVRAVAPVSAVLTVVAVLLGSNLRGYPQWSNDDEGTYYAQGWAVLHEQVMAHYTYWYDHPPLGWIQLAVLLEPARWVTGNAPVEVGGRLIMVLAAMVSAGLLYKLSRNLGLPTIAAMIVPLLWAASPLTNYLSRQIFLDNIALPWVLATFVLVTSRPRLTFHVAAGVTFAIAFLTKETSVLVLPGVLLALWYGAWRPTRIFSLVGWVTAAVLGGGGYLLFAAIKNELTPGADHVSLLGSLWWQLHARAESGYFWHSGTDAAAIVNAWMDVDSALILVGLAFVLPALALRGSRAAALVPLVYILMLLRPGYLPQMFPVTALPFLALCIVSVTWWALRRAGSLPRAVSVPLRIALTTVLAALVITIAPTWRGGIAYAMNEDLNASYDQSLAWVDANLDRDSVIITDDNTWNDLTDKGWASDGWHGGIWHFKLDRDVEAQDYLPNGWRDADYIYVTRSMAGMVGTPSIAWGESPQVVSALNNSTVIRSWGTGSDRIELRQIDTDAENLGCTQWQCPAQEPAWPNPVQNELVAQS